MLVKAVSPCCFGFYSCPRWFEGAQENAASSTTEGFQLFLQVIPSCLNQLRDPSSFPMMILNWICSSYLQTSYWFFYARHKLMPPLGSLFPMLDVLKTSQCTLVDILV